MIQQITCLCRCTGYSPECFINVMSSLKHAGVVELVDTTDSKSVAAMRAGSSPASGTTFLFYTLKKPTHFLLIAF